MVPLGAGVDDPTVVEMEGDTDGGTVIEVAGGVSSEGRGDEAVWVLTGGAGIIGSPEAPVPAVLDEWEDASAA